jgi:16S rRNA (cytosine967-C5)-methyltransferase
LDGLPSADRAFARAIASTTLRRLGQIRAILSELIERPPPRRAGAVPRILEIAAAQLLFMNAPDHAVVSTAMELADADAKARHFKPLANGTMRNIARRRDDLLARHGSASLNVPDWLRQRWISAFGQERVEAIAAAHLVEAPLDISVKSDAGLWADRLGGELLPTGSIRCRPKGRVDELPGYDEGAWWVQDAAAALPALLLGDVSGLEVLDLCAAPGGKAAELALAGARVTAVDIAPRRVDRMRRNLARLGLAASCIVADAKHFDPGRPFDAVLVDAPCSATGTIRRHPDVPWLKSGADIGALADVQRDLLASAVRLVRPGGTIVFATCSLEPEEGEAQAVSALSDLPLRPKPIAAGEIRGLVGEWLQDGHLRTLPFHAPGPAISGGIDGFFAARFVKA